MDGSHRSDASRTLLPILGLLLLVGVPATTAAQGVTGRTVDADDGEPVGGAEVILVDASGEGLQTVFTDSTGSFGLPVMEAGSYTIRVRHLAYRTVTSRVLELEGESALEVELRLGRDAIELDSLIVLARDEAVADHAPEYYRRLNRNRRQGLGRILSREDLEPLRDRTVREALERELVRFENRGVPCTPMIFWNGLAVSSWEIPVSGVEGIEVYRRASEIPTRYTNYQHAVDCGLVLVWSRVRRPGEGTSNSARAFLGGVGAFVLITLLVP